MTQKVLLGDEAVALGAIDAGIHAAYAYPGTPSTEILEYLLAHKQKHNKPFAAWCANEKTSYEEALGVSFAGRRAMVSMKHVGLNVAADPFMNSALVTINGGLVVVSADDPGMHSSQNEQDSRYYADFAHIVCLEPANQQEAYEMTREAFDVSERFHIPVMVRIVTRLAHSRSVVNVSEPRAESPLSRADSPASWILLPVNARRQWHKLLETQKDLLDYSERSAYNSLRLSKDNNELGVITTGIAKNYYLENLSELDSEPSHLHIGVYPLPVEKIRKLVSHVKRVLILEEGYPYLERYLRGIIEPAVRIQGKLSGEVPREGELTPDNIRNALDLPPHRGLELSGFALPNRPPRLCTGCPHADSFHAIKGAVDANESVFMASDIGCYSLGALPPYSAIETCVCMGASIGMAKGASDAGLRPAIATIGDSTFLHSGVTALMDCIAADTDMTVIILDNETVGMTGGQPTILPDSRLESVVLGLGAKPEHVYVLSAHPKQNERNAEIIHQEINYNGLSVIITVRECLETLRRKKRDKQAEPAGSELVAV
ncbi:MAG: indolepyruvate ferredoxin oxidoreductase [Acidobacteria bacterium]|nr:indolepyruvate ferredoxin oxidoreductase [Acidobacteriota bacterium]